MQGYRITVYNLLQRIKADLDELQDLLLFLDDMQDGANDNSTD